MRTNRRKGLLNKILKLIVSVYLSKCHEEELYARNVVNKFLSCLSVWHIVLGSIFNFACRSVCCLPVCLSDCHCLSLSAGLSCLLHSLLAILGLVLLFIGLQCYFSVCLLVCLSVGLSVCLSFFLVYCILFWQSLDWSCCF